MTLSKTTSIFFLVTTFITIFLVFIPTFLAPLKPSISDDQQLVALFDDTTGYLIGYSRDPFFREAAISGLIMALVPGADLMVEFVSRLSVMMSEDDRRERRMEMMQGSVRMTMVERALFILGTVTLAGNIEFPAVFQSPNMGVIYWSTSNLSTIAMLIPCVMFLHRVQPGYFSFSGCYFVVMQLCVAVLVSSFGTALVVGKATQGAMLYATSILVISSTATLH